MEMVVAECDIVTLIRKAYRSGSDGGTGQVLRGLYFRRV